ncbi:hypothetical protein [Parapedobacter tibetensis]|uniref:hypothetical protein n=1 Tax=Parapedobacter tibetensis TaxID=2972951 RepID=UPI00214DB50E|nr:hypothetical protein [Parapedobacter tibetensis]
MNTLRAKSAVNSDEVVAPQAIGVGTVAAVIGVVQGVIGVVKSFTGGKKTTKNTQTSIQFDGIVNTTGTSTISNNLYSMQFHQDPEAALTANRYVPLYTDRIGIMTAPEEAKLWIQRTEYYNCAGLGMPPGYRLNVSNYKMRTNGTHAYFSIDNIEGLKVDSVTFALVSKQFVDPTKESFLVGMNNSPNGGWRDLEFAGESRRRSERLTWDSVQTRWKAMIEPVGSWEDDPKYITLAQLYYPSGNSTDWNDYMTRPSYTETPFYSLL